MRSGKSLFERLDAEADDMRLSAAVDEGRAGSVRRHLRKLLNTRAGSVATLADYGLRDFNDISQDHSDLPGTVAAEVAALIQKYEPRLTQVEVLARTNPDNPTGLRFTVSAALVQADGSRCPATFDLSVGRDRTVRIA